MVRTDNNPRSRRWVDLTAGQIRDPMQRLRFLQAVAPHSRSLWKSPKIIGPLGLFIFFLAGGTVFLHQLQADNRASPPPVHYAPIRVEQPIQIWQVEKTDGYDTYSNGLRIENRYSVSHRPRAYLVFATGHPEDMRGQARSSPAGIVFHTTESLQAPFEPSQNSVLKRVGESLLVYVQRHRCYNFVIDRFGRVFRVVQESDAADHAGHSVWADDTWSYVNLNDSFLGVSFETQTTSGQLEASVNPAQLRGAAMLTEMLRDRYQIPAGNCVTHAQVSVNPANMQIGYHTDWASSFPFEQLGLPDNYAKPFAAVWRFGFQYDSSFEHSAGARLYQGAQLAGQQVQERAAAAHIDLDDYRKGLQKSYWKIVEGSGRGAVSIAETD